MGNARLCRFGKNTVNTVLGYEVRDGAPGKDEKAPSGGETKSRRSHDRRRAHGRVREMGERGLGSGHEFQHQSLTALLSSFLSSSRPLVLCMGHSSEAIEDRLGGKRCRGRRQSGRDAAAVAMQTLSFSDKLAFGGLLL